MEAPPHSPPGGIRSAVLGAVSKPETRVALVAGLALIAQAVVAKNVLDVELDFGSQFAALWVFIVFSISDKRGRLAELAFMATIVAVTAAVLALYAVS